MRTDVGRQLILLLGGARSGKSAMAQRLAQGCGRVLFVATAEPRNEEMRARITRHRAQRPPAWETLEEPLDLARAIRDRGAGYDAVVLDCLTLWVSNVMLALGDEADVEAAVLSRASELVRTYEEGTADWIVVSNEVGLGVVPGSELARAYRDALGRVNQLVAARADKAYLLVAGRALALERLAP